MHPTQQYVHSVLGPHHRPLCDLYERAWERYLKYPEEERAVLVRSRKALAVNVWALATDEALKYFFSLGIAPRHRHGSYEFPIHQNVVLRFKMTDSHGSTSQYRTKRAVAYNSGLPLPDVPEQLRVTVGWVPNEHATGIDDVLIALQGPAKWCYSISTNDSGGVDLFTFDVDPSDTGPNVRPRYDDDSEDAADEAAGGE